MSPAFNPGTIIVLQHSAFVKPQNKKKKTKKKKKSPLEIQFSYGMISPQPTKSVRNERVQIFLPDYQIGAMNVAYFSTGFYQLYIKM